MGKTKTVRRKPPARTPEQRESELINLAMKNAEELMIEGRAPSQVITHFLKLGTAKHKYELEKLKADTKLADAKVSSIEAQQRTDELYEEALKAFKLYDGEDYEEEYD